MKAQVGKQVQKYLEHQEEEFLYETGLEKNVWYRRVRGEEKGREQKEEKKEKGEKGQKKMLEQALDKQVERFLKYKQQNT